MAHAALRHRIVLNFEAEAEGVTTEAIVDEALERTGNG
jgi:MoxR-like ATPase